MRFLSVCSGIEAASVAWNPLGWKAVAFSEIEPFPCAVLAHHYPDVPNHGDMTKYQEWPDHAIDLLCGGTPCQSFSVAGMRKGLDDPRGNLMLTFGAIAARYRPRWLVWENVPGVLSSNGGRDFGAFLGMLGQLGYGFAYRVLDAQYFGLAQRRRRVFVVGCLGDWRSAAAVLFERHSMSGHPAPRREAREGSSASASRSVALRGREGGGTAELGDELGMTLRASSGGGDKPHVLTTMEVTPTLTAQYGEQCGQDFMNGLAVAHAFDARQSDVIQYGDKSGPLDTDGHTIGVLAFGSKDHGADAAHELAPTLRAGGHSDSHANAGVPPAIAYTTKLHNTQSNNAGKVFEERSTCLDANSPPPALLTTMQVRRLTPRECERLQGFPDDYTSIPYRGKPAADGPRYKAIGNSWAVPNARWIGQRIDQVEAIAAMKEAA